MNTIDIVYQHIQKFKETLEEHRKRIAALEISAGFDREGAIRAGINEFLATAPKHATLSGQEDLLVDHIMVELRAAEKVK